MPEPNLSELERQLQSLAPAARLDRDRLMYAAGRASVRPVAWPLTALAFGILAVAQLRPPEPTVIEAPTIVPSPEPPAYLALRDRVLSLGVDAMTPGLAPVPGEPAELPRPHRRHPFPGDV